MIQGETATEKSLARYICPRPSVDACELTHLIYSFQICTALLSAQLPLVDRILDLIPRQGCDLVAGLGLRLLEHHGWRATSTPGILDQAPDNLGCYPTQVSYGKLC